MKKIILLLLIILNLLLFGMLFANNTPCQKGNNIKETNNSKDLGWISDNSNSCSGYYSELPQYKLASSFDNKNNYNIKADQTSFDIINHNVTFRGHVVITKPNQSLETDSAIVYSAKDNSMDHIDTFGHVRFNEMGKLILAEKTYLDVAKKQVKMHGIRYRISRKNEKIIIIKDPKTGKLEHRYYGLNGFGSAVSAEQKNPGIVELNSATYSTCTPTNPCWQISAKKLILNSNTGIGSARNAKLYLNNIPVLYLPKLSFSIDKRRKSGFLMPTFDYASSKGLSIGSPYYWNIAPNYDLLITPNLSTTRGLILQTIFRYLTDKSTGNLKIQIDPFDSKFKQFKNDIKNNPAISDVMSDRITNASIARLGMFFQNTTKFNNNWTGSINFNRVSDDYFIEDFGNNIFNNSQTQLLEQASLVYSDETMTFLANIQGYQTLHPYDQIISANQYIRLPQLVWSVNIPDEQHHLDYNLKSEADYFTIDRMPGQIEYPMTGGRIALRPGISAPFSWPYGYFTPSIQWQLTKYSVQNTPNNIPNASSINIPMFDIKSGLYFDRNFRFLNKSYRQTLEPQAYYLFVPYENQNNIPIFDATSQIFNYNYIFMDNRFSGFDRIGDTNQISLGLTSRIIDDDIGEEKAKLNIGQIYYFSPRKVTLCTGPNCKQLDSDLTKRSPIAGQISYALFPKINLTAGLTYNTYSKKLENHNIGMQYLVDNQHVINLSYNYVKGGDIITQTQQDSPFNDLKQTDLTAFWKLNNRWSLMGRWNYNWSHNHVQTYFYGVSYDKCCWSVRLLGARSFVSIGADNSTKFDNKLLVQFVFKGLGSIKNEEMNSFLTQSIPGYVDNFEKEN